MSGLSCRPYALRAWRCAALGLGFALAVLGLIHAAGAADSGVAEGRQPVEVSADGSLEWYQDKHLYVARGGAKAVHGDTIVEADLLVAHQRVSNGDKAAAPAGPGAGASIDHVTAEGHVRIRDSHQRITGDKATYDLDRGFAQVTGGSLSYVTAKDSITARDALEYDEKRSVATARGQAVAVHEGRRIEADLLQVTLARGPDGAMRAQHMMAEGHVVVVDADRVARGDRADYDVAADRVVLNGHVRVTSGTTQLKGDKAEVDFAKGQSRLLNDGTGRVTALLSGSDGKGKRGAP